MLSLTPTGYPPQIEKTTAHIHVTGIFKNFAAARAVLPDEKAPSPYAVSDRTENRKSDGITVSKHIEIPRFAPYVADWAFKVNMTAAAITASAVIIFFVLFIFITGTFYAFS